MGGAQRTARKRRQDANLAASRAVGRARRTSRSRTQLLVGVGVVVVLAVVVAIGVVLTSRDSTPTEAIPAQRIDATYPVSVQNGVVVAGAPNAPVTVDAYEDFLCPVCGLFEAQHGEKIVQALNAGRITVRYHMLNLLDRSSNPAGYSLTAANAGLCAADAGIFPSMHASLFASQPKEGGSGYTVAQLVALGHALGAPAGFDQCVGSATHDDQVKANLAGADAALASQGGFQGTPTVLVNGGFVNVLTPDGATQFDTLIGRG